MSAEVDLEAQHHAFNAIAALLQPLAQESRIRLIACFALLYGADAEVMNRIATANYAVSR